MWCWIARWQMSRLAERDAVALPPSVRRHLVACPECQQQCVEHRSLESLLRSPLPAAPQPSPHLRTRVMASLSARDAREDGMVWALSWASGVAVVAALVALFVVARRPAHQPRPPVRVVENRALAMPEQLWHDATRPITDERDRIVEDLVATRDFLLAQL